MESSLTLVVLAAGASTRFGGGKQLAPVGPNGEALFDYAVFDALRAGFRQTVTVIQRDAEDDFRAHVERVWGSTAPFSIAIQESPSASRTRPWGTGHAILSCQSVVEGAFAAINADDWYPPAGFVALARVLGEAVSHRYALVVYRLDSTPMSAQGGVSRAVCEISDDGILRSIVEVRNIRAAGDGYVGEFADGHAVALAGSEFVSMNLWGFSASIFAPLEEQLRAFQQEHGKDGDAEFYIGAAVDDQIRSGLCEVQVIDGGGGGVGMTYAADRSTVAAHINASIAAGIYPAVLRDGLA